MAANSSQLSDFPLPAEGLNKIAGYVLVHGGIHPDRTVSTESTRVIGSTADPESLPGIQLIVTCEQAYHEDHTLFCSSNTFYLPSILMFLWSIGLRSFGCTTTFRHRVVVADLGQLGWLLGSPYWSNVLQRPHLCVYRTIEAEVDNDDWKTATEWLCARRPGELAERLGSSEE